LNSTLHYQTDSIIKSWALKIAVKERKQRNYSQLTIFSDSQPAIQRILNDKLGLGQALAIEIIAITEELKEKDVLTTIRWC
jgi:hypothetical protein